MGERMYRSYPTVITLVDTNWKESSVLWVLIRKPPRRRALSLVGPHEPLNLESGGQENQVPEEKGRTNRLLFGPSRPLFEQIEQIEQIEESEDSEELTMDGLVCTAPKDTVGSLEKKRIGSNLSRSLGLRKRV